MRQHRWCNTLNRRISVRSSPLLRTASMCLLLFLAGPWSFEPASVGSNSRMVSAATSYMPPGGYVTAATHPPATSLITHSQEKSVAVPVSPSAATKPLSVYHYPISSSSVPPSSAEVPALFCPPGFTRETPVFTSAAHPVPAVPPSGAETSPVILGRKQVTGANLSSIPECSVRALPLPESSISGSRSKVVVMARSTPGTIQASTPAQRRGTRTSTYVVDGARTSAPATRTVIQQQPLPVTRTHKTLCLRRTWPSARVRQPSTHLYERVCAPVSTLHTYDPVALPVSPATSAPMHAHGPALRTVIPRYKAVQTPARSRTFPLHEQYTYADGESEGTRDALHSIPSGTGAPETLAWPRASHMVATDAQLLRRRRDTGQGTHLALLQMEIDDFCRKRFQVLCSSQGGRFCTASRIVGRYGPGGRNDMGGWRCYNQDEMSMSTRSVGCVDQCGNLMRCLGAAGPNTTSVPVPELDEWVLQRKWQHCSPYQQAADALCNFKTSGDLARYDLHRKRWMCLDLDDIAFEGNSYCVDNCGSPVPCVGGLIPGLVPKFTVHIVQHPDMERAFEAIQPCPDLNDVCIATVLNPPRCVKQSTTILIQRLSGQQERMDEECQQNRDDACRRGTLHEECFRLWLARYDKGAEPDSSPSWRCYPEAALDFTQMSRCADGCGNIVPCRGAPLTPTPLAVNVPKAHEIMSDPSYCSAYQRAANNYCQQKRGSGFVARQHCKTFRWQCLDKDHLPSQGWTGCIGHCGEAITCPAGVDDRVEVPNVEDAELVRVITSVPNPCPQGETCDPVKQAPPYCSVSRPRHSSLWNETE